MCFELQHGLADISILSRARYITRLFTKRKKDVMLELLVIP